MSDTLIEVKRHHERIAPIEQTMRRALAAHDAAWKSPKTSGREAELSADLQAVRRQAALLRCPSQGEPNYKAELALWEQAQERWSRYSREGLPVREAAPDPLALVRQRQQVAAHMQALGARGIHLSISETGEIIAKPSVLLLDVDRRKLKENRAIVTEMLAQEEHL